MKMPQYETEEDKANEKRIAERYQKYSGLAGQKLNDFLYHIDRVFYNPVNFLPINVAEIKCFKKDKAAYSRAMFGVGKITHGLLVSRLINVPLIMLAEWNRQLFLFNITGIVQQALYTVGVNGRPDRPNDPGSFEPVIYVDFSLGLEIP